MYSRSVLAVIADRTLDSSVPDEGSYPCQSLILTMCGGVGCRLLSRLVCILGSLSVSCIRNPQTRPKTGPMRQQSRVLLLYWILNDKK